MPPRRRAFPLTPTFLVLIVKYKMVQLKRKKDELESKAKVVKKLKWKAPNSFVTDTESNIEFVSLFYPIYDGWQFRPTPPLFNQPSDALAWSISRIKKDGFSNIWNHTNFPNFMHFVSHVQLPKFAIEEINLPTGLRPSMLRLLTLKVFDSFFVQTQQK